MAGNPFDQFDSAPTPTVMTVGRRDPAKVREDQRQAAADARAAEDHAMKVKEWNATHNPDGSPNDVDSALNPQTTAFYAQQILAGGQMPALGMGKQAAAARQAIMAEVARQAGANGLSGADLARQMAHYKAGSKQIATLENMLGTIQQAEETALANGQQFIDASSHTPGRTKLPVVNSIIQSVARGTGNPDVAAMDVAWKTFTNEYAKVISGSPSGAGTLSDTARREAMDTVRGNAAPAQKQAAFEQMKRDMANRIAAIHGGINEAYAHLTQSPGYAVPETTTGLSVAHQRADNEVPGQANGVMVKPDANTPTDPGPLPPANMPGGNDPTPPPVSPAGTSVGDIFNGATHNVDHPEVRAMTASMINAGAGLATINAALKQKGFPAVTFGQYGAIQKWMKDHPGKQYPASSVEANTVEPLNVGQRISGSAPGAFLANVGNSATAGIPAYLAGDKGAGAIDAMDALHPTTSMLGGITGGIIGSAAGELGAARGGEALLRQFAPNILRAARIAGKAPTIVRIAPRVSDATYGAISGYTGSGGDPTTAAVDALIAPIAGKAGEATIGALGSAAKGVTDPFVQYLRSLNIPLTVGQAVSRSGIPGKFVKKTEDVLASILPQVENRRTEGLQGFNKAAFDVGAETTGNQIQDYGASGLRKLDALKSQTYDRSLDPVTLDVAGSPTLPVDINNAQMTAAGIPKVGNDALDAIDYHIGQSVDPNGMMTGRDFQEAYRGLGRSGRENANGPYGHEYGQAMRQGQDALATGLEDQNPGAYQGFLDANAANRRLRVLADALGPAKNQEDALFTPAQLNTADFNNASKLTGKVAAASGDRPFYDLARAGQAVLPSKVPDSGTATRAAILKGLVLAGAMGGGGGYVGGEEGAGTGLGLATALMLGGSRPSQKVITKALLDRPDLLRTIGAGLKDYSPYASIVSTPGGLALWNTVNGQ